MPKGKAETLLTFLMNCLNTMFPKVLSPTACDKNIFTVKQQSLSDYAQMFSELGTYGNS